MIDLDNTLADRSGAVAMWIADFAAEHGLTSDDAAWITDCLTEMRTRGWQIAIVTNGSTKQQNAKIDHLGFRSMVDAVTVSETLGIKKPAAGIFEHAASLCGVKLEQQVCWMVGDSAHHDIGGAQALGLSTAWIPRGRTWPVAQPSPEVIVRALASLPDQLVAAL